MDLQLNIKVLNTTATRYIVNSNEENTVDLNRQLDVFVVFTKPSQHQNLVELESTSVFITECAPKVVDILLQPDTAPETCRKILSLLQNLMSSSVLKHELKTNLQLTPIIAGFVHERRNGILDQCLDILEHLTYEIDIPHREPYLDELVAFLINHIQVVPIDSLVQPCLSILTNMCRKNSVVQKLIRNKASIKIFYRRLLAMIDISEKIMLRITALSTLTALAMNDDMGSKLFCANNLSNTLELVHNTIFNKNRTIQAYAIDLYVDLMAVERIQQHFLRSKYFESTVTRFLELLVETKEAKQISKIFELHLTVCSVCTLRRAIIPIVLKWEGGDEAEHRLDLLAVITKWIGLARSEGQWDNQLNALRFLLQLLKEPDFLQGNNAAQIESLVWTISENLSVPWQPSPFKATKLCERMIEEIAVLLKLCENKNYVSTTAGIVDTNVCTKLVDSLMNNDEMDGVLYAKRRSGFSQINGTESEVTHVIVSMLTLMVKIRNIDNGMEAKLYGYLQEPLFMRVLARSLASESEECVQKALGLICLGTKLANFPQKRLSMCIVTTNANQKVRSRNSEQLLIESPIEARVSVESEALSASFRSRQTESVPIPENAAGIDGLIEKVEKGMQISDIKQSQIMEMYERKLQSLDVKHKSLQDLLDAKSQALQQADRLMAHYRCRWAQSDADAVQLRSLLCDAEKRSESAKEETTKSLVVQQNLGKKVNSLKEDIGVLDKTLEEQVKRICEQKNRISALEETNSCLEKEYRSLIQRNTNLQTSNDKFRQKLEEMTSTIGKLELGHVGLTKQVKERDSKISDLTKSLNGLEKNAKCSEKEIGGLKEVVSKLEKSLASLSNDKKLKESENAALEARCKEYEKKLASLQVDRDKYFEFHRSIINMSSKVAP